MIASRSFAICFTHSETVSKKGTPAGRITLGGADKSIHSSPMVYAEHREMNGWYEVVINGIYLKHQNSTETANETEPEIVKIKTRIRAMNMVGTILDSGTTETYFPSFLLGAFSKAFEELMGTKFSEKASGDVDIKKEFPTIMIQLKAAGNTTYEHGDNSTALPGLAGSVDPENPNDVMLEIPPERYMLWRSSMKAYKSAFHMNDSSGFGVLGANSMYGHDILFDVENKRIGFAPSDCSTNS